MSAGLSGNEFSGQPGHAGSQTSHSIDKPMYDYRINCSLRVALHYGGEVQWSVKSISPRHGYLRQGMDGMLEKMKTQ